MIKASCKRVRMSELMEHLFATRVTVFSESNDSTRPIPTLEDVLDDLSETRVHRPASI